jgi:hypothetical protein
MGLSDRLIHLLCDQTRREELAGDLMELAHRRAARMGWGRANLRQGFDIVSVCVRQSRFRGLALRRLGIGLAVGALLAALLPNDAAMSGSFTVNARDPAGEFTLEVEDGRVLSATLDGIPVSPERLRQRSTDLTILGGAGDRDFSIELQARGIRWVARVPRDGLH